MLAGVEEAPVSADWDGGGSLLSGVEEATKMLAGVKICLRKQ